DSLDQSIGPAEFVGDLGLVTVFKNGQDGQRRRAGSSGDFRPYRDRLAVRTSGHPYRYGSYRVPSPARRSRPSSASARSRPDTARSRGRLTPAGQRSNASRVVSPAGDDRTNSNSARSAASSASSPASATAEYSVPSDDSSTSSRRGVASCQDHADS